jgi:hypothetical protein
MVFSQTMFRAVSARSPEGRVTFTGVGADSPWLTELMGTSPMRAPAWEISEDLGQQGRLELAQGLARWSLDLRKPAAPDRPMPTEAQREIIREQGYWRPQ